MALSAGELIDYVVSSQESTSREKYMRNADKFWKLYRQESWWIPSEEGDDYEGQRPVTLENRIFEKVETIVSVFFKHLPIVELRPFKPSDYDIARIQNRHIQYAMREAKFLKYMREGTRECMITGMNVYHTGWDASKTDVYGNGDCAIDNLDRHDVFLDSHPGITDVQKSRFCALRYWLPAEVLLERFGKIAADALGMSTRKDTVRKADLSNRHDVLSMNVDSDEKLIALYDSNGDMIPIYEVWYRTRDYRETQLADKSRSFSRTETLPRVAWLLNGVKVKDIPHPYHKMRRTPLIIDDEAQEPRTIPIGHGQFPVVRQVAYQVQDEDKRKGLYDVMGVVEQLESLQWDANDIARQMSINARTIANPPVIVNGKRLVHPKSDTLILVPGMKIEVDDNGPISEAVRIEQPASIPSYTQYVHQTKHQMIDQVSGVKGFVAGNIHGGTSHTTAEGTNVVSEADFSMMWTLIHNTEDPMENAIRHFSALQRLFYRIGRYTSVSLHGRDVFSEWTTRNVFAEFDYDVVSGSATPQQDIQRVQHVTFAQQMVQPVLQDPTPDNIRLALFSLEAANLPWTYEYIDWLRKKLEEVEAQAELERQAAMLLEAAQLIVPQQPSQPDFSGIDRLAAELGVTSDSLLAQFAA